MKNIVYTCYMNEKGETKMKNKIAYDYEKQVWIVNGKYEDCGHKPELNCTCYGRIHKNETAILTDHCE